MYQALFLGTNDARVLLDGEIEIFSTGSDWIVSQIVRLRVIQ